MTFLNIHLQQQKFLKNILLFFLLLPLLVVAEDKDTIVVMEYVHLILIQIVIMVVQVEDLVKTFQILVEEELETLL